MDRLMFFILMFLVLILMFLVLILMESIILCLHFSTAYLKKNQNLLITLSKPLSKLYFGGVT